MRFVFLIAIPAWQKNTERKSKNVLKKKEANMQYFSINITNENMYVSSGDP